MTKSKVYDAAKVALMLLVVLAHGSRMYDGGVYTPVRESFSLRWLTVMIYVFHMPAFFMLSGCLWGHQAKQGKYRKAGKFLKKKGITLLLPYLIIGICIVAPTMVGLGLTEESFFSYVWNGILLGKNNRHLWYLTALFWMFLMTVPLRRCLTVETGWGCFAVAALCLVLSVFAPLPGLLQLSDAAKYAVFFFAGVCMDRCWNVLFGSKRKCLLVAAVCLCVYGLRAFRNGAVLFYVCAFAGSIAMFAILSLLPEMLTQSKAFCLLRENSFGIYLLHPMLIYLLFACTWYRDIHPWVLCGSVCLIALAASVLLSMGLRSLGLGFVLGEARKRKVRPADS